MNEMWRSVVGWEGLYEVSQIGSVRSVERIAESYGGRKWLRPSTVIKQRHNCQGYLLVNLSDGKRYKTVAVHRLVALAFLGPHPIGITVNHKDGDKNNNTIENLEYCTMAENLQHALRTGLRINARGSKNGQSKLNEVQVIDILRRLGLGESQTQIAKDYPVTSTLINLIAKRRIWQHVQLGNTQEITE